MDSQLFSGIESKERPVDNLENVKPVENTTYFPVVKGGIDEDIKREPIIEILLDKFNGELLQ